MKLRFGFLFLLITIACQPMQNESNSTSGAQEISITNQPENEKTGSHEGIIIYDECYYENYEYTKIDEIIADIDTDNIKDTISVYYIPDWSDPGDFKQLEIVLSSGNQYQIYDCCDWITLNSDLHQKFKPLNHIETNKFLLIKVSDSIHIIVITGYPYQSDPGTLTIFGIKKGKIFPMYKNNYELIDILDMDGDNYPELVGFAYERQTCGGDSISICYSYKPYHVLDLHEDTLVYNAELSENYNHEHYIGFFGLELDYGERYNTLFPSRNSNFKPCFEFEKYRDHPELSLRYLNENELKHFSKVQLRLLRNEIFAFHGYLFESPELRKYFSESSWYKPEFKNVNFRLNKFEKANIQLLLKLEKE